MNLKMKQNQFIKISNLFIVLLFIISTSCTKDDSLIEEPLNNIETVNFDEAIDFLNLDNKTFAKNYSENYITPYVDYISHEDLLDTNKFVTVIPATTNNPNLYSKIVLLKINNEIKSVVYSMLFDTASTDENFTGEILITDLQGNFVNGFVVENGLLTLQYQQPSNEIQSKTTSSNYQNRGDGCEDCPYTNCSYCELDTVYIEANNSIADAPDIDDILWANNIRNNWVFATSGGSGGGSYPNVVIAAPSVVVNEPDTPITDVTEYFECFDTSQGAEITIYATEPDPGTGEPYELYLTSYVVGHTFVSITQGSNTSVFGFYPEGDDYSNSQSALGNDSNENFTASITTIVTGVQLQSILNHSINFSSIYDVNTYNCTNFAIEIGNLAGMGLPGCTDTWPGGGGSNPGTLGLYIRNLAQAQGIITTHSSGSTANATHKDCN